MPTGDAVMQQVARMQFLAQPTIDAPPAGD
jgi:hypothetical protein